MKHGFRTYLWLMVLCIIGASVAVGAPTLDVVTEKYASGPGEAFPVEYRITWEGDPAGHTVLPPALPSLDWGEAALLEVQSRKTGEVNEVRLVVGFTAGEPGVYEAPAFDIRVMDWNDEENTAVLSVSPETPAQVMTTPPVKVTVRRSRLPWTLAIAGILAVALGTAVYLRARRKRRSTAKLPDTGPMEQGLALLHEARRHRLDGDYYAYYRALRQAGDLAARESGRPDERLGAVLEQRLKDTGYRGRRPSEDELEGDFKDVEQQLARMNERP